VCSQVGLGKSDGYGGIGRQVELWISLSPVSVKFLVVLGGVHGGVEFT
jgi:hypothetical protein